MGLTSLKESEFRGFQKLLHETAGIYLSEAKKPLVSGRLAKRIAALGLSSYGEYLQLVMRRESGELQQALDLLTTNETFFFREQKHFDFLGQHVFPRWRRGPRRIWSAACSSGEEAYTLAMVLAESAPTQDWEIVGTDISTRVLEAARTGKYAIGRIEHIPRTYLVKYCLRGTGREDGVFMVGKPLRSRVRFERANLLDDLSGLGSFDLIFLRNVLIYFDVTTKRTVVGRLVGQLRPGGLLVVGHSESLNGVCAGMEAVVPSVYRKP